MNLQILIAKTPETATLDGARCCKWRGVGPDGGEFEVWVHRVRPLDAKAQAYAEDCLTPVDPPSSIRPDSIIMGRNDIRAVVAQVVAENRWTIRETRTQAALDRLVETAHQDGEDVLAMGLMLLNAARCMSQATAGEAAEALSSVVAAAEAIARAAETRRPDRGEPAGPSASATGETTPHTPDVD